MTAQDQRLVQDGRVVIASQALALHLVDRLGYLHDAIAEAEQIDRHFRRGSCSTTSIGLSGPFSVCDHAHRPPP